MTLRIVQIDLQTVQKRVVAVYRAQGRTDDAINELNEYLATFINDNEAWMQLGELYLSQLDYARAAHCYEELLVAQPMNAQFAVRYADVRYTQGGLDNVDAARTYFVHAAKLGAGSGGGQRAIWGVLHVSRTASAPHFLQSCNWLAQRATGQKRKELITCAQWAVDQLTTAMGATPAESDQAQKLNDMHRKTAVAIVEAMQSGSKDDK